MAELVVLDVAHGCSVILTGTTTIVFDAGPGSALLEYLSEASITDLAAIYISHADSDHIKGVIAVLGSGVVSIGEVWLNSDGEKDTDTWRDLVYELDDYHRRGELRFEVGLVEGHICPSTAEGISAEVVAPRRRLAALGPGAQDSTGEQVTTNSISAVIRVSRRGEAVALLTGDLDRAGLAHLVDSGVDIRAQALVFPHHGGHCSRAGRVNENVEFTRALMDAVRPKVVLFSIGRGQHGTPRAEIVDVVRNEGSGVRIACTQLSERCSAMLPDEAPVHLVDRFASGRERRRCCAGTMIIPLEEDLGSMLPTAAGHQAFIARVAPSALCGANSPA